MAEANINDPKIDLTGNRPDSSGSLRLGLSALVIILGCFFLFYFRPLNLPVVKTVLAESVSIPLGGGTVLNATGYVTARRSATVSSEVSGKITEILV